MIQRRYHLVIAAAALALSPVAADVSSADVPGVYDRGYAAEQQRIERAAEAACKRGNIAARLDCKDRQRQAMERDNPRIRGTDAYCQTSYVPLSSTALRAKAGELARLRPQARYLGLSGSGQTRRGQLFVETIEFEYRCVHDILARRGVRIGVDLPGGHIPDADVCREINCRAGQRPAAPSGGPLDVLRQFNSLFE